VTNNGVHVRLGDDGSLSFKSSNTTHLVVDCVAVFKAAYPGGEDKQKQQRERASKP
jgi:hypothetical protein